MVNGKYPELLFESDDDVLDVISMIIKETKEANKSMGKNFDIEKSVNVQIPFFACRNILLNKEHQDDIARYIYCTKMETPPYPGSYSEQPLRWIKKAFIIKSAIDSIQSTNSEENRDG